MLYFVCYCCYSAQLFLFIIGFSHCPAQICDVSLNSDKFSLHFNCFIIIFFSDAFVSVDYSYIFLFFSPQICTSPFSLIFKRLVTISNTTHAWWNVFGLFWLLISFSLLNFQNFRYTLSESVLKFDYLVKYILHQQDSKKISLKEKEDILWK